MSRTTDHELEKAPSSSVLAVEEVKTIWSEDEYTLATLGYKQELKRGLGLFEGWASIFTAMNFVSGMPVLFGFAMYTGGPQAAFSNWTMVGACAVVTSLSMAEIAAASPTAGGIYFWSYQLGGEQWGPFLAWMTAWWNWAGWVTVVPGVQQGSTNYLLSALQINYPDAAILSEGWFSWILTSVGLLIAAIPNIYSQRILQWYFRGATVTFFIVLLMYWTWVPIRVSQTGQFRPAAEVFQHFYNGINQGDTMTASDSYCWVVGILFGAWVFYGYDASAHIAEETQNASENVAKSMWMATMSAWLMSIPTVILILFCIQNFDAIIDAKYANNWAEFLVQTVGPRGATAILSMLWIDNTCGTASCIMSAQRVTYAISRDGVLPGSQWFKKLTPGRKMPVNAAYLVLAISILVTLAVIGSNVAFTAITATATIATNFSYLIPIVARHTVGKDNFRPAAWNLGRWSLPLGMISSVYIAFICIVLLLPQVYPVTGQTLNYAPVAIGAVTLLSSIGWFFPKYGAYKWFKGPQRTILEGALKGAVVQGRKSL